MRGLLAAGLLFAGATSASAAEHTASFRFGGIAFEAPLPEGFCLPTGANVDLAQLVAAGDQDNVTHLTLYPCEAQDGSASDRYILVKTPRRALFAQVEREQLLAGLGEVFESREFNSALASVKDRVGEEFASMVGMQVDLTGSIRPLGRDDVCAYIGGSAQVASEIASYTVSTGACMTVVSGRILSVYWYGPDNGSAGVAELLRNARAFAESISGRPVN